MAYTTAGYDAEELDRSMVRIPGGRAVLGLTPEQKATLAADAGVHPDMLLFHTERREADLPDFWIDRHPVTRGQFLRFMEATGYRIPYNGWLVGWTELTGWHDLTPEQQALPMVGVNAEDAAAYAAWLGKRLPTEDEWEAAWRGTDGRLFPWGDAWQPDRVLPNPGNRDLAVAMPVGALPPEGPHGLGSYGLVLEWVRVVHPAHSKQGTADPNPAVLAGGSFAHALATSFLSTNRLSWSHQMRIYNGGFRCVSDTLPDGLVDEPRYRVVSFEPPEPVAIRPDLYLHEPIRLVPTECSTLAIQVPWFPRSLWVLDCPEGNWGPFGGANAWPFRPEAEWRVPWQVSPDGARATYHRRQDGCSVRFEAWVEGHTVRYGFEIEGLPPVPAGSFCFKTFSPFFSSQERWTQVRLEADGFTRCCQQPLPPDGTASFFWSLGEVRAPARAAYLSYDGTAQVLFPEGDHVVSGNGWPPCTHVSPGGWGTAGRGSGLIERMGSGSYSFVIP